MGAVKIRAVTLGLDLPVPNVKAAPFSAAASFLSAARAAFGAVGLEVQTTRVAGPDLSRFSQTGLASWAKQTEAAARDVGIEYLAFGRLPAAAHTVVANEVAPILAAGEIGFFS